MEKELVEKAVANFRVPPTMYNCAQTVASVTEDENIISDMKSCGGGRAPDGLCGALYAAIMISPPEKRAEVRKEFEKRLGAQTCTELKQDLKVPCPVCVRVAAEVANYVKGGISSAVKEAGKVVKVLILFASTFLSTLSFGGVEKDHLKLYASFDNTFNPDIALDGFRTSTYGDLSSNKEEGRFSNAFSFRKGGKPFNLMFKPGNGFGTNGWTIAMWINMDEAYNYRYRDRSYARGLFSVNGANHKKGGIELHFSCWSEFFLRASPFKDAKEAATIVSSKAIPRREWTHVALVFRKDGTHDIYLNGNVASYLRKSSRKECTPVEMIHIGACYGADKLDGCIDELKVFNKSLSSDEVSEIMMSLPLRKTADIAAYIPCDGNVDGRGVASLSAVDLIFDEGASYEGVKITRHGYDRRTIMTLGGIETGHEKTSLFFYFKPDWKKDEPKDVRHGLLATGGKDFYYTLEKNLEGIVFTVFSNGKSAKAVLKDVNWDKNGFRKVAAGYDYSSKKMYVALDDVKSEAEFNLPRPNAVTKTRLFVGEVRESDYYSKTQAEGMLDEILVVKEFLSPLDIEEVLKTEIAKKVKKSVVTIENTPPTKKEMELWNLDGAQRRNTLTREIITLNALWRFQLTDENRPFDSKDWIYLAVPGRYAGWENGGAFAEFDMRDKNFKVIPRLKYAGQDTHTFVNGWYERAFVADEKWKGKIVTLKIDELSTSESGCVFFNGKVLANLISGGSYFNIQIPEHLIKFGELNYITINSNDSGARWNWRGVKGDVYLEITDSITMCNPEVVTSLKNGELTLSATIRNKSSKPTEVFLEAEIVGKNSPGIVKFEKCEIPAGGELQQTKTIPWKNADLWDIDNPSLYTCTMRLRNCEGAIVDEGEKFKFGFREFEVRGRDFYLNGKKIHLFINDQWPNSITEEDARKTAKLQKDLGFNAVRMDFAAKEYDSEILMRVCDEEGLLFFPNVRGVSGGSYALWANPEIRKNLEMQMRSLIYRWRNHASAVMWYLSINFLGYSWDYHPLKIADGYINPNNMKKYQTCLEAVDFLRKYDSSKRPYFFQAGGTYGEIQTSNAYFCWWPQTERRAWPEEWEKIGTKPMIPIETGFPYLSSFYGMDLLVPGVKPLFYFENLARYFGPDTYSTNDVEILQQLAKSVEGKEVTLYYDAPQFQKLKSWLLSDTLKYWRGFDLSGFCPFAEIDYAFGRHAVRHSRFASKTWRLPPRDFRRFGYTHDREKIPYQKDVNPALPLPSKDGLSAGMAPELSFFDGGFESPVDQRINYYSNDRLVKRLALINDRRKSVTFTGEWTIGDKTQVFSKIVAPGGKTYIDIDIKLPEVNKITKLILSAKVKGTSDLKIDSLSINVYPKKISTDGVTSFALYDPIGKTAQKFKSLGLPFVEVKNVSDVKSGLLVIGSCAITSNLFADVKDNVKNGKINLLSMVQTEEALKGLGVVSKNIYAREAFYSDGKTVGPWAGIGKMSPHKAPPSPETEKRMPSPFFHWNNQNVICSCPILRPKNGAYEALLTCGKDLVYAPVIKVECGKGQIVFCQLEIEDRTKADPQADNLLIDVLSFSSRQKGKKMLARVANLGEAAKYGVTVEDASVQMFDIAPLGEKLFSSFSKRDRFFRKPMALKTFSGEGVTPLFEPAFAAVKEVNGEKIVFLGVSENLLDDEFKLAEKAGEKSSILWAAETQEGRFNLIRSILETACGVEHDFPSFNWQSQYNTETHIRW